MPAHLAPGVYINPNAIKSSFLKKVKMGNRLYHTINLIKLRKNIFYCFVYCKQYFPDQYITSNETITSSENSFFNIYTATLSLSKTISQKAKSYVKVLDQYNRGLINPGHGYEDKTTCSAPKSEASSEKDLENLFMETTESVSTEYSLSQNHPNPFNPSTSFTFDIPKETWVKLTIYNIIGQRVANVVNEYLNAGYYTYNWTMPANLPSGTYIYRLETADFTSTRHMLFMK